MAAISAQYEGVRVVNVVNLKNALLLILADKRRVYLSRG